ncbi:Hypothetical protein J6898_03885 [Nakaseomyces glabratus]
MRLYRCFSTFAWVLSWSVTTAKTYQNEELVLDSTVTGDTSFTEAEQLVLDNAKITLKNYSAIHLTSGIILRGNSLLNIETTSGNNVKYSLTINGEVKLDQGSQFIFDGSSLKYSDSKQAYELFNFDINSDENGLFISKDSSMKITVPKLDSVVDGSIDIGSIHIGGTYKAPYNSPIVILGKLEMLSPEQTVDNKYPLKYWRLDLGTDRIDEAGIYKRKNDLSGIISCEGVIGIYADIFSETTDPKIYTLGYIGYSIVSPLTIDLAKGPMIGPSGFLFLNVFPKGQDGIKFVNADLYSPNINDVDTTNMLFSTFYDSSYQHVDIISEQNAITIRSGLDAIATYYSDRHYSIINHCSESSNSIRGRYPSILLGGRTCSVFLTKQQKNSESNGLGSDSNSSIPEQKDETGSIPSGPDMDGGPGPHPGGSDTAGGPGPNPNGSDTAGGPGPNPNGSDTAGGPGPNPNGSDTAGGPGPNPNGSDTEGGSGSGGSGSGGSGSEGGSGEGGSGSGEGGSGGSNPVDDGKDKTTVVTDKDGHVHTDIISHITTTDKDGKPTVILTQYQSPTPSPGEGGSGSKPGTGESGSGSKPGTGEGGSGSEGGSGEGGSGGSNPVDDGKDKTTVVTDKDGHVHTDIISHITTTDKDGKPTVILTQYQSPTPSPGEGGSGSKPGTGEGGSGSNPGAGESGSGSKPGTGEGGSGSEGGSGEGGSGGSNPVDDGKDKTTVVTDKDGHVHTDIISHITTTDKDGKPTVILTQYQSPTAVQNGISKTITVDGEEIIEAVHITTYTDSDGHTITSTYTEMFKTLIDAEPQYVGETTQTITTTDTEGHTTTITTTYNIDNNGNTAPIVHSSSNMSSSSSIISSSISSAVSTPSGQDYIITTTGSDGKIETDIVSHITTTVNGKPTTITTTVPCDVSADKDRTTTVTHSNGVIETNVVSHITTTVNGKPTTITTTTTKLNNAHTTTLTNKDGSVDTKIVVGVTTTNQFGQPVITSITYTPKADSHSNNNVGTVAGTKGAAGNNPSGTNKPQTNPTANAGSNGSSPAANAGSAVVPKAPASNSAAVQQQSSASGTTPGASAAPTIQQINKNAASSLKQTKFCVTIVLTILMLIIS